jgi:hypothetical protein
MAGTGALHRGQAGNLATSLRRRLRQVPYGARYLLNAYPAIYVPLSWLRHRDKTNWLVQRDTDLVIEGFGRSGSTFAVLAFELAQTRSVRTAHHTHAAAQVIRAARFGVPTLLIVRDPVGAALSHMVRRGIPARPALAAWSRYHARILPYRERFVIVRSEALSTDLASAIRELNIRFGTDFREFENSEENVAQVFEIIELQNRRKFGRTTEIVARPTVEREQRKAALRQEVQERRLTGLRTRAYEIYRQLIGAPEGS